MEFVKNILICVFLVLTVGGLSMYVLTLFAITSNIALTGKVREENEKQIAKTMKAAGALSVIGMSGLIGTAIVFTLLELL